MFYSNTNSWTRRSRFLSLLKKTQHHTEFPWTPPTPIQKQTLPLFSLATSFSNVRNVVLIVCISSHLFNLCIRTEEFRDNPMRNKCTKWRFFVALPHPARTVFQSYLQVSSFRIHFSVVPRFLRNIIRSICHSLHPLGHLPIPDTNILVDFSNMWWCTVLSFDKSNTTAHHSQNCLLLCLHH